MNQDVQSLYMKLYLLVSHSTRQKLLQLKLAKSLFIGWILITRLYLNLQYLNGGDDPNLREWERIHYGRPLLSFAAINGYTQIIELLIKSGAKVDKPDFSGQTPLPWAAEYGRLNNVELLIENGANVNSEDKEWEAPLRRVIYADTEDKANKLYNYFVRQDAKVEHRRTRLW